MKKLTTKEFIIKAKEIHGNKYDYTKVNYLTTMEKVCIICPEHGEFWQSPNAHLHGKGCAKCGMKKCINATKSTKEKFVKKAKDTHGNKYDYSKVEYVNNKTKVCIICPIHGEFWQTPYDHTKGCGCPKCKGKNMTTSDFIEKAKKVHGDKYDYSKVEYINSKTKICIICPKHGEFWITPNNHLNGHGCEQCYKVNKVYDTDGFIRKAKEVHGDKYDYSKVEYKRSNKKVCIICPIHGEFWQTPNSHLNENGCPKCIQSKLEKKCSSFLAEHNIKFNAEKTFRWLGNQRIDFYLIDYNVAIECQGLQHFKPIDYYGGLKGLRTRQKRDYKKFTKCHEHGISIFYFTLPKIFKNVKPNLDIYNNNLFTDLETIFSLIKK